MNSCKVISKKCKYRLKKVTFRDLIFIIILSLLVQNDVNGQTLTGEEGYKVVNLGNNGQGDYTRSLILLHEVYQGTLLPFNKAIGTITALRGHNGALNRISVGYVNTS